MTSAYKGHYPTCKVTTQKYFYTANDSPTSSKMLIPVSGPAFLGGTWHLHNSTPHNFLLRNHSFSKDQTTETTWSMTAPKYQTAKSTQLPQWVPHCTFSACPSLGHSQHRVLAASLPLLPGSATSPQAGTAQLDPVQETSMWHWAEHMSAKEM